MSIILASGSETRRRLLVDAGVEFRVVRPSVDESTVIESLVSDGVPPRDVADFLAELKAKSVSGRFPDAFVVGCDQVLTAGGKLFQKPRDVADARRQLLELRGRRHELMSAVCVARGGSIVWRLVERAQMDMRSFSEDFLDQYLSMAGEAVLGSVGAYQVEGPGIQLFSRIEGDHAAILGLPLLPLLDFLRLHGEVRS